MRADSVNQLCNRFTVGVVDSELLAVNPVVVSCHNRSFELLPPVVGDDWTSSVKRIGQGNDRADESLLAR